MSSTGEVDPVDPALRHRALRRPRAPRRRHDAVIRVNGKDETLAAPTVAELLRARGIERPRGVAVALNGTVVPAAQWPRRALAAGDEVEIVRPFGGG